MTLTLHLSDILPDNAAWHLSRADLARKKPTHMHTHEFFELIWVQNGKLRHLLPDRHEDLSEGDLLFVRPEHHHALQGKSEAAMVVTLALHPDLIAGIAARHPELAGQMFWANSPNPVRAHRDFRDLAAMNAAALRLERAAQKSLAAEAFLLPLLAELSEQTLTDIPDWLAAACHAAQDPKVFREGAAGFVKVTGRAHAHVSRMARLHLGQSPSEYTNAIRMDWAARKLTGSTDPLPEIASDCGLPNLSHFHRLFRERFGETPHQYRLRLQRNLVQPEE